MSRYARDNRPYVPKVQRAELKEGNYMLRAILVGVAIAIAVAAFGYGITRLLTPDTGWQSVDATTRTPAARSIQLSYCYGQGEMEATLERRSVANTYSDALEAADEALSTESGSQLASLWENPNTPVQVGDILYKALETYLAADSRGLFYAPLYSWYNSLFACQSDDEAAMFDPTRDPGAAEYVRQVTAFVSQEDHIRLELLPDNTVTLHVSQAYLDFCEENGIEALVDFGWVKNAFLLDAVADALEAEGLNAAMLASDDGYSRCLTQTRFGLNLLEYQVGTPRQAAQIPCDGPISVAAVRAFPMDSRDEGSYYAWADGSFSAPYLDRDTGLLSAQNENLALLSSGSVGQLALAAAKTMATWQMPDCTWVYSRGETVYCSDASLEIQNLYIGYSRIDQ